METILIVFGCFLAGFVVACVARAILRPSQCNCHAKWDDQIKVNRENQLCWNEQKRINEDNMRQHRMSGDRLDSKVVDELLATGLDALRAQSILRARDPMTEDALKEEQRRLSVIKILRGQNSNFPPLEP